MLIDLLILTDEEEPGEDNETVNEDDREPALKRARQESPKLSSLLLAGSHKRTSSKKISKNGTGMGHKSSSSGSFPYNLPTCTKVLQVKKKSHSGHNTSTAVNNNSFMTEIPILPKGLASCLSITNIPNPVNIVNHVGGGFGSHSKDTALSGSSPGQVSMKPMPSLKKMVPSKHQGSGSSKSSNVHRTHKSSSGHSTKVRGHSSNSSSHNVNSVNSVSALHCAEDMLSPSHTDTDNDRSEVSERQLSAKLATQRIEFERREHELKVRLLEKELENQRYQSQYWSLKLKLLRSGRDNATFNFAGATNGDID